MQMRHGIRYYRKLSRRGTGLPVSVFRCEIGNSAEVHVWSRSSPEQLPRSAVPVILATMTLKSASLLALIGTVLMTLLVAINFFNAIVGVSRGIVPAMELVPCLVYFFAGIAITLFFWVFSRSHG